MAIGGNHTLQERVAALESQIAGHMEECKGRWQKLLTVVVGSFTIIGVVMTLGVGMASKVVSSLATIDTQQAVADYDRDRMSKDLDEVKTDLKKILQEVRR